jgi:chemotaxis protein histidine kinase CheA
MGSISNILGFAFLASEDTSLFETSFILSNSGHLYRNQDEFSRETILGDGTAALVIDLVKLIQKHNLSQATQNKKAS